MNIEEFREMGSCKKVLKVTGLAFDNTFFPMDMLKDSCNITMFVLTVAAIDIYLRSAPTTEPSHIWTLVIDFTWCKCGARKKKNPLRIASKRVSSTQSRSTKYIFAYSYFILNSLIMVYIARYSVK